ncbi:putative toxin-antitoxin system toxin component, PIN family [Stigmatella aurantiaca]|uniref:Putative toxin-antitoxin system toxin component, PIN family n=1 Tax=Stigmatella aurantiaca TaxID=41 RepID=A0A1H8CPB4_STIAU|nr:MULTISPECIES: putative toxin-antitoxin system toxin component, PIN family [Stigmatella]SEM96739.1 putative toxin-antitoxin system toxin component, PIN family [Stigmatella aurantiaca]
MPPSPPTPQAPLSLILDTNVVLDLLLFNDPLARGLSEALSVDKLIAWADRDTLTELERVLTFRDFPREGVNRHALLERYRGLVRLAPEATAPVAGVPRCRDRSDQKFLELAARTGAHWLVSKDRQVLSLADRRGLPFEILSLRQASARLAGFSG